MNTAQNKMNFRFPLGTTYFMPLGMDGIPCKVTPLQSVYPSVSRFWHAEFGTCSAGLADILKPDYGPKLRVSIPVIVWEPEPRLAWISCGSSTYMALATLSVQDPEHEGTLVAAQCDNEIFQKVEFAYPKDTAQVPQALLVEAKDFVAKPPCLVAFEDTPEDRALLANVKTYADVLTLAKAVLAETEAVYQKVLRATMAAKVSSTTSAP